jgi:hypothetical protein
MIWIFHRRYTLSWEFSAAASTIWLSTSTVHGYHDWMLCLQTSSKKITASSPLTIASTRLSSWESFTLYMRERWAFVQPESISLQIIKNNYHIRFCLKSDGCKVISIAHHHIQKQESPTHNPNRNHGREIHAWWNCGLTVTLDFSSEMNGWP